MTTRTQQENYTMKKLVLSGAMALAIAFPALAQHIHAKEPNQGGAVNLETEDPAIALQRLHPQDGYEVTLWASEKDFELYNPVAMTFDAKGRMWVSTMPSYPQRLPDEEPNDKILILEDTNHDGKADKSTVFIDHLHLPGGFELGDGGAYISEQPDIIFAKDTNGDDHADTRETILHGFGTEDSHHAIHAYQWGPDGGLYFQEGTFHHSQVETPYGPVRLVDAGIFRYEPWRQHLEVFVSYPFANPWGHVFDRWGQNFIADASGGANYYGTAITGNAYYPDKRKGMKVLTTIVRPTAGCEIVSSRQFPEEAQGNFLVNNVITFQGIKQHKLIEDGSGFRSEEQPPLLYSDDMNFRPVHLKFGPDGALYVVDWFNPLIGHMQYSLRDPRRDHSHGRIWRVAYKGRPALTPPLIDGQPLPKLLDLLKTYEDRTRYRVRIEIRSRFTPEEIERETNKWVAGLDKKDPQYEHNLLEALWVYQTSGIYKPELLDRMLHASEPRARAGAVRVLRFWREQMDKPLDVLERMVNDDFPRVRLESLLALSYFQDAHAPEIAVEALQHPTDYYLDYVLGETMTTLQPLWKTPLLEGRFHAKNMDQAQTYLLDRVGVSELAALPGNEPVYRALLRRKGVNDDVRAKAIDGLARTTHTAPAKELVAMIAASSDPALVRDLGRLLAKQPTKDLVAEKGALATLTSSANGATRETGYAALITASGPAAARDLAKADAQRWLDVLRAVPALPDAKLRDEFMPDAARFLDANQPDDLHGAAIAALASMEAKPAERFDLIAGVIARGKDIEAASAGLGKIADTAWPKEKLGGVVELLTSYVKTVPTDKLSSEGVQAVFSVGDRMAAAIAAPKGPELRSALANLGIRVVNIRPTPHLMMFETREVFVKAGQPVEIVFENIDIMPHNLVVTKPGAMEAVGKLADAGQKDPDAPARGFVPRTPDVLHFTRLLNPGETQKVAFIAPTQAGDYPYVCTYPGHWITMNGVMHVVEKLDPAMLAAQPKPNPAATPTAVRKFVKFWTLDDLKPTLEHVDAQRSFDRGRELFTIGGCVVCHKFGGAGGEVGPDLTKVHEKYNALGVLEQIMDPSLKIDDQFKAYLVKTKKDLLSGPVVSQDTKSVKMRANPLDLTQVLDIPRGDIVSIEPSPLSTMPSDLLITFNQDEVLDLIAYLLSAGDANAPAFKK